MKDEWSKLNEKYDDLFLKYKFSKSPYEREILIKDMEDILEKLKKLIKYD